MPSAQRRDEDTHTECVKDWAGIDQQQVKEGLSGGESDLRKGDTLGQLSVRKSHQRRGYPSPLQVQASSVCGGLPAGLSCRGHIRSSIGQWGDSLCCCGGLAKAQDTTGNAGHSRVLIQGCAAQQGGLRRGCEGGVATTGYGWRSADQAGQAVQPPTSCITRCCRRSGRPGPSASGCALCAPSPCPRALAPPSPPAAFRGAGQGPSRSFNKGEGL